MFGTLIIQFCINTGADGVMTSEAILENPALFANQIQLTQLELAKEYLNLCKIFPVWHFKSIRSHILKFLYRYFHHHYYFAYIFY